MKEEIFRRADESFPPDAILASNTSSIPITSLAAVTSRPEHGHRHALLQPGAGPPARRGDPRVQTSDETAAAIVALAEDLGKTPAQANDFPGFVSNRILMPFVNEAAYALMEGVADADAIDTIAKLGFAHPLGPLALADLIGLDTCVSIMDVLHAGLGDPKYAPCPLLRQYVAAGRLGRKIGPRLLRIRLTAHTSKVNRATASPSTSLGIHRLTPALTMVVVTFVSVFALGVQLRVDTDVWWHLRAGALTLRRRDHQERPVLLHEVRRGVDRPQLGIGDHLVRALEGRRLRRARDSHSPARGRRRRVPVPDVLRWDVPAVLSRRARVGHRVGLLDTAPPDVQLRLVGAGALSALSPPLSAHGRAVAAAPRHAPLGEPARGVCDRARADRRSAGGRDAREIRAAGRSRNSGRSIRSDGWPSSARCRSAPCSSIPTGRGCSPCLSTPPADRSSD